MRRDWENIKANAKAIKRRSDANYHLSQIRSHIEELMLLEIDADAVEYPEELTDALTVLHSKIMARKLD